MRLVTPGDSAPASINRYLLPQEKQVIVVRKHPAVLMSPVLFVLGGLILAGVLSNTIAGGKAGQIVDFIWLGWLVLLGWFVWQVAEWSVVYFVITNQRMLLTHGLITRDVAMMPLSKVTDMSYERSALGRLLGYGKFIAESAGQDQALRTVPFLPYPDQLYAEVCQMIFPNGKTKSLEERLREVIESIPKMRTELAAEVTTGNVHDLEKRRLRLEAVQGQIDQLVGESGEWHRQAGELHRQLAEPLPPDATQEL